MASAKILENGQITIPKKIRDSLGLKKDDVVDTQLVDGRVVITPRQLATSEDWKKLIKVMNSVHDQNRGISEEEVYQVDLGNYGEIQIVSPEEFIRILNEQKAQ